MMGVTAKKSRRSALLCELDIFYCLLACTVIIISVSLLHFILYETGGEGNNKVAGADKKSSAGHHLNTSLNSRKVCQCA